MKTILLIGNITALKNRTDKNLYNFYCYLQKHSKHSIELYNLEERQPIDQNKN